jgi:transcriptional regulator of acetoin/glycerol metabolism
VCKWGSVPHYPEHIADRLIPSLSFRGSEASRGISQGAGPTLAEVERSHLDAALKKTGGNQSQAARLLGISRATLLYRMKKHGLS